MSNTGISSKKARYELNKKYELHQRELQSLENRIDLLKDGYEKNRSTEKKAYMTSAGILAVSLAASPMTSGLSVLGIMLMALPMLFAIDEFGTLIDGERYFLSSQECLQNHTKKIQEQIKELKLNFRDDIAEFHGYDENAINDFLADAQVRSSKAKQQEELDLLSMPGGERLELVDLNQADQLKEYNALFAELDT